MESAPTPPQRRQDQGHRFRQQQEPCRNINVAVQECMTIHGKFSDECVRDKLRQKKCFAELLCPPQARSFYKDKIRGASFASCSTLVEPFAFPENEMLLPQELSSKKDVKKECRGIVHELSKCMSKHELGRRSS